MTYGNYRACRDSTAVSSQMRADAGRHLSERAAMLVSVIRTAGRAPGNRGSHECSVGGRRRSCLEVTVDEPASGAGQRVARPGPVALRWRSKLADPRRMDRLVGTGGRGGELGAAFGDTGETSSPGRRTAAGYTRPGSTQISPALLVARHHQSSICSAGGPREATMPRKSPQKPSSKKPGKSLKERRADKKQKRDDKRIIPPK
jgi:hypothetical protein